MPPSPATPEALLEHLDWVRQLARSRVADPNAADDLAPELAAREWDRIRKNGIERVRFAWRGGTRPGEPHYWRLHGPHFVVEYDNVQSGANHVHTLWRDLENDFGGDLLRRHHEQDHSGEKH